MVLNKICKGHVIKIAMGITVLAILLLASSASAIPVEEWNKTFGGKGSEGAYSVQQTTDAGYILIGYKEDPGTGIRAWLIKTDAKGNERWSKIIDQITNAYSIEQTSDGGYVLIGNTGSFFGNDRSDVVLIKTDGNGNQQWKKIFGGTGNNGAKYVQQTSDGGYMIAGYKNYSNPDGRGGISDAWLIKTDASGNKQWDKIFGGTGFYYAKYILEIPDGGYLTTGEFGDSQVIKVDSNGNQQWKKTLVGKDDGVQSVESIRQTTDGGYILAGKTRSNYKKSEDDILVIKLDSNGFQQWKKIFGESRTDWVIDIQQTPNGGYIIAAITDSFGLGDNLWDGWLIKLDLNGNEEWNKTFGGRSADSVMSVQQTTDGGYILAGTTKSYGAGADDAWLVKVGKETTKAQTKESTEKAVGFEIIMAITTLSAVYIFRRKRR